MRGWPAGLFVIRRYIMGLGGTLPPSFKGVPRLAFTARNLLIRPIPSAPRRALVPDEHSFTVRVLRARKPPERTRQLLTCSGSPNRLG